MTHFILIRHGETMWNREHRIQGQLDSPLSPTGHAQALAVAQRLKSEGVERLVSSDLGRTIQTATPLAEATGLTLETDARLRERHFGVFQAMTPEEIQAAYPEDYVHWQSRDPHFAMPQGESLMQFRARLAECLEGIASQGPRKAAIITHGGALDALYRIATGTPYATARNWALANASLNDVVIENGQWRVVGWGDIAHLTSSEDDFA